MNSHSCFTETSALVNDVESLNLDDVLANMGQFEASPLQGALLMQYVRDLLPSRRLQEESSAFDGNATQCCASSTAEPCGTRTDAGLVDATYGICALYDSGCANGGAGCSLFGIENCKQCGTGLPKPRQEDAG